MKRRRRDEDDVVIDLRDEVLARESAEARARREWEESADLVDYAPDVVDLLADARRDSIAPRSS